MNDKLSDKTETPTFKTERERANLAVKENAELRESVVQLLKADISHSRDENQKS